MQDTSNLRLSANVTSVVVAGSFVVSGVIHGVVTSSGSLTSLKRCNRVVIDVKIWSIIKVTRHFSKHIDKMTKYNLAKYNSKSILYLMTKCHLSNDLR